MKNFIPFLLLLLPLVGFSQSASAIKKTPQNTTKFGQVITDDYTWLEKFDSKEVKDWVAAQNQTTAAQMKTATDEYSLVSKLKEYDRLSSNPLPIKKGRYYYSLYRIDKSKPGVLYFRKSLRENPIEIANPYKVYKSSNAYLVDYAPSRNSKYLAVELSKNGSDLHQIRFADIDKIAYLEDSLTNIKFSNISWNGDKGIFYKKNANAAVFARDSSYQLFYHKIGKPQSEDQLVFDATQRDGRFSFFTKQNKLFVIESNKEETAQTYYQSSIDTENFHLEKLIDSDTTGFKFLHYANNKVYFSATDYDWGEVRCFDLNDRSKQTVVIPQIYSHLLVDTDFLDDYIVCKYKTLGKNYLSVYSKDGVFIRKFEAPFGMDYTVRFYDPETKCLFVSFYSYTLSFHNFKLNIETGEAHPFYTDFVPPKPTLFPLDYFETKILTYKSRDGKDIPITIVHKKGIALDGNNPTLLKGYGGFGTISHPRFDTGLLYFLEKGGVFAYAEIRGGGDKGLKWHTEGKGLKKMNTFNDFIDAAEFLIREKYTSPPKLGISGGSQGGTLVGVAVTQRPELFKVAIPMMGAYDMLKFKDYTVGKFHLDEYGDSDTQSGFRSLMGFSPYHNIKEDVNYPTMLIITSENDDRVPPIHSYKFAARLQNRAAQKNPILLKTLAGSGHYGKANYQSAVEENAEFYAFLLYHLNR
ncbi:prolyl oligopeptidase family serine peptidase [Flavobacterium sp.]|uniref:prolyl oligopeptidase family serine peptidase n=1 Tax=Flavobacterium sp. TaxID=239 RepID=UPI0039E38C10